MRMCWALASREKKKRKISVKTGNPSEKPSLTLKVHSSPGTKWVAAGRVWTRKQQKSKLKIAPKTKINPSASCQHRNNPFREGVYSSGA